MTAARHRGDTEPGDCALKRVDYCRYCRVADHMEPGGDARLGAGEQMLGDPVGIEIAAPGTPGLVGIGSA